MNNDDINVNTDRLMDEIKRVMDTKAPFETIRISGKRGFVEPWVKKGLKAVTKKNRKLFKKTLQESCSEEDITTYKRYLLDY